MQLAPAWWCNVNNCRTSWGALCKKNANTMNRTDKLNLPIVLTIIPLRHTAFSMYSIWWTSSLMVVCGWLTCNQTGWANPWPTDTVQMSAGTPTPGRASTWRCSQQSDLLSTN